MYIHFLLKFPVLSKSKGLIGKLTSVVWDNSKYDAIVHYRRPPNFFYNIGGLNFTLEEIKHGVLRGNRKSPGAMFRNFSTGDKRNMLPDVTLRSGMRYRITSHEYTSSRWTIRNFQNSSRFSRKGAILTRD